MANFDRVTEIYNAFQAIFSARRNVYAHFAKSFYGFFVPDELREEIHFLIDYVALLGDSGKELTPAVGRYCEAARNVFSENTDSLEFEYNRLFVGPARLIAPPYESVYRTAEHLVMGETMLDVRRAYRELDMGIRNTLKEPEDHIAIELEYLAELQKRCLTALEEQDIRELRRIIGLEQAFLEDHLLRWVPEFCQGIKEGSRMEFFSAMAEVLVLLVKKDHEILEGLMGALDRNEEEIFSVNPSQTRKGG